jgi:hypothetical protein
VKAPVRELKYKTDIWLIRSVVSWKLICLFVDLSQFAALFIFRCFVWLFRDRWRLVGQLVNVLLFRLSNLGFTCCKIVCQSVYTLLFDSL